MEQPGEPGAAERAASAGETARDLEELCRGMCACGVVEVSLPAAGAPSFKAMVQTAATDPRTPDLASAGREDLTLPEYHNLVYRATLQAARGGGTCLEEFCRQAAAALRAFRAACALAAEGHVELRARRLPFAHREAARAAELLAALQGQWASAEGGILMEAAREYPLLAHLTPAALARLAELVRSASGAADPRADAQVLLRRWRGPRQWRPCRGQHVDRAFDDRAETLGVEANPEPTALQRAAAAPSLRVALTGEERCVVIEGSCTDADGEYVQRLMSYRRADGAVLAPCDGGWVVFASEAMGAPRLLASVQAHHGAAPPWEVRDWREADGEGGLCLRASPAVRVRGEECCTAVVPWSHATDPAEREISCRGGALGITLRAVTEGQRRGLFVADVAPGMRGDSVGFEPGMQITAVDGGGTGTPAELEAMFQSRAGEPSLFRATVVSPWCWAVRSQGAELHDSAGRTVTKSGGDEPSVAMTTSQAGPASRGAVREWRLRLSGDCAGMRVGVALDSLDLAAVDQADSAAQVWWYTSCGTLSYGGTDVALGRPYWPGDVVGFRHHADSGLLEITVNGEPSGARFEGVPRQARPCVYLRRRTCTAEISEGAPLKPCLGWGAVRGRPVRTRDAGLRVPPSERAESVFALGDTVFRGPGPHEFSWTVQGPSRARKHVRVGLVPPAFEPECGTGLDPCCWAVFLGCDGTLSGPGGEPIDRLPGREGGDARDSQYHDERMTMIVDFGVGTMEIRKHGRLFGGSQQVAHTRQFGEALGRARGPLVPCFIFDNAADCVTVRLHHTDSQKRVAAVPGSSACRKVVVTGTRPRPSREMGEEHLADSWAGPADGVYHRYLPVYVRKDGRMTLFYWGREEGGGVVRGGRWCVADGAEQPRMWSEEVRQPLRDEVGSTALAWTVAPSSTTPPKYIRVIGQGCGGLFVLTGNQVDQRPAWRRSCPDADGQDLLVRFVAEVQRWAVSVQGDGGSAFMCSSTAGPLPHLSGRWAWGDTKGWHVDDRVAVLPLDGEEVRMDGDGMVWTEAEWRPASWAQGPEPDLQYPQDTVRAEQGVSVTLATRYAAYGQMRPLELACWHIIHGATGARPSTAELRRALAHVAQGAPDRPVLALDWRDGRDARAAVHASARALLERIGALLRLLNPAVCSGPGSNFDPRAPRFGPLQGKVVTACLLDASRLPPPDRKVLALALFEPPGERFAGMRGHHLLDCTATRNHDGSLSRMPAADVAAFVLGYRAADSGRFVLFAFQDLAGDVQAMVRKEVDDAPLLRGHKGQKEFIVIISGRGYATGGNPAVSAGGRVESIQSAGGVRALERAESVDRRACDAGWRRWAHGRVRALQMFRKVVFFDQGNGRGKSYTIDRCMEEGHWGRKGVDWERPTRLDLDSCSTVESVCDYLARPFLSPSGLLIVHVGLDTDLNLANRVIDGLALCGGLSSPAGLTVATPPVAGGGAGWDLVVELQAGPDEAREQGGGCRDLTLLAVVGLGSRGELRPFCVDDYPGAQDAVEFIRQTLGGTRRLPRPEAFGRRGDDISVRMIVADRRKLPEDDPEVADFIGGLDCVEHRTLARACRFLSIYPAWRMMHESTQNTVRMMWALSLWHETGRFACHESRGRFRVRRGQESRDAEGSLPEDIDPGSMVNKDARLGQRQVRYSPDLLVRLSPHQLIEALRTELNLREMQVSACMTRYNYVVTPDLVRMLEQLALHVDVEDPVVVQGPPGAGKSRAVTQLSQLIQLPAGEGSARDPRRRRAEDLPHRLWLFARNNPEIKRLFPNNVSDMVGEERNILWRAACRFAYTNCFNAMEIMAEHPPRRFLKGLNHLRISFIHHFDLRCAEFAEMRSNDHARPNKGIPGSAAKFDRACRLMQDGPPDGLLDAPSSEDPQQADAPRQLAEALKHVARISARLGNTYNHRVAQVLTEAITGSQMREFIDDEEMRKACVKVDQEDALQEWAPDAVLRAGANAPLLARTLRDWMRENIEEIPLLHTAFLEQYLAAGDEPSGASGDRLARAIKDFLEMDKEEDHLRIPMRTGTDPCALFRAMRPLLERALQYPKVRFVVFLDEVNATAIPGLLKRIMVDRRWDRWEAEHPGGAPLPELEGRMPPNVSFVATADAHAADVSVGAGRRGLAARFMPPALREHCAPWHPAAGPLCGALTAQRLTASRSVLQAQVPHAQRDALCKLLCAAHKCIEYHFVETRDRAAPSQRDICRASQLFDLFFERDEDFVTSGTPQRAATVWVRGLSAMLLSIGVCYFCRLPPHARGQLGAGLTRELAAVLRDAAQASEGEAHPVTPLPEGTGVQEVLRRAVEAYTAHVQFSAGEHVHSGLTESIFVQMCCVHCRIPVILHGSSGSSRALSTRILERSMRVGDSFWRDWAAIGQVYHYRTAAHSRPEDLSLMHERAAAAQRRYDRAGAGRERALLCVNVQASTDTVLGELHHYLERADVAVVITADRPLDPALADRCVTLSVQPADLAGVCAGILRHRAHGDPDPQRHGPVVAACCEALSALRRGGAPPPRGGGAHWKTALERWYGPRDLLRMMHHIGRGQRHADPGQRSVGVTADAEGAPPAALADTLERSGTTATVGFKPPSERGDPHVSPAQIMSGLGLCFSGPPELFGAAVETFGAALHKATGDESYSALGLWRAAPEKQSAADLFVDSLQDRCCAPAEWPASDPADVWGRCTLLLDTTPGGRVLELLRRGPAPPLLPAPGALRLLRELHVPEWDDGDVASLSVLAQLVAAMEAGALLWLTGPGNVACLCALLGRGLTSGTGTAEAQMHVTVPVGGRMEITQVHKDFQCILHVARPADGEHPALALPAHLLSRVRKFALGADDVLSYHLGRLEAAAGDGRDGRDLFGEAVRLLDGGQDQEARLAATPCSQARQRNEAD
eukprot:TRINITY_DN6045_c0_g2_i5.p1 TRINITY_DN6045_c0_g2~~TRINITY_DN6045_c0_g2_i5.p1  ORF type:complete len:2914 (+),score=606.94 TRINITY_DN6045_c0_g2_i5:72-8744(+)